MDIFRLLSRSSGLQKKGSKQAHIAVPTSTKVNGVNGPTKIELPTSAAAGSTSSNKKRKPGSMPASELGLTAPELDFFGLAGGDLVEKKTNSSRSRKRKLNGTANHGDESEESSASSSDEGNSRRNNLLDGLTSTSKIAAPPRLPTPTETRQLSKTHKLKTTHMNPPSPPPPPQPPKHKKSRKSKPEPQPAEPLKKLKLVDTPPPTLLTHFTQLSAPPFAVSKRLYRNLVTQGYENPTPVQMAAIPLLLLGHQPEESYLQPSASPSTDSKQPAPSRIRTADPINLLTCAQTGSGKTLAYLLPLMDWVLWRRGQLTKETRRGTKVVIAAPTKELVNQIYNEALKLAIGTGVRVSVLRKAVVGKVKSENHGSDEEDEGSGGESEVENSGHENKKGEHAKPKTKVKADIVVSTPTMFLHAIQNDTIDLSGVQRLILDEADVLLERNDAGGGFGEETAQAWGALISAHSGSLKDVRVWMWSATISSGVEELASKMISPTPLSDKPHLGDNLHPAVPPLIRLLVGIKNTSLPHITHTLTYTSTEPGKLLALRNLLRTSFPPPALIFLQTVPRATALFDELQYDLPPGRIALLHAQLSDQEREGVMERFRKGEIWALVTTDLLSRGVDWRGVRLVINYDVPGSAAGYIHRAGRTGRAGVVGGEVITYYTKQDVPYVRPTAEVIVAAEKERERLGIVLPKGKEGTGAGWLLGYLPRVGKREKRRLKKYGVEVRNGRAPTKAKEEGEEGQKRRKKGAAAGTKGIGTTPGWEKQREHRRMGAVEASKKRARMQEDSGSEYSGEGSGGGEEWIGFS